MSKAIICDRCGSVYKSCKVKYSLIVLGDHELLKDYVDLCSDCQESLNEWLYKYKTEAAADEQSQKV